SSLSYAFTLHATLSFSAAGLCVCFFFSSRRRHTRSKRDWSSDVCSSDLFSQNLSSFFIFGFLISNLLKIESVWIKRKALPMLSYILVSLRAWLLGSQFIKLNFPSKCDYIKKSKPLQYIS